MRILVAEDDLRGNVARIERSRSPPWARGLASRGSRVGAPASADRTVTASALSENQLDEPRVLATEVVATPDRRRSNVAAP